MSKQIRIVAQCPFFSLDETVSEAKAEKRLKEIRKSFELSRVHFGYEKKGKCGVKLSVRTSVVNPTLI